MIWGTLNLVIAISALLAVAMLVKAGIEYIISAGDASKAEKAQKSIVYVLIGLIFVFVSPLVIRFVLERMLLLQS